MLMSINNVEFRITHNDELGVDQAHVVGGGYDVEVLQEAMCRVEEDFNVQAIF